MFEDMSGGQQAMLGAGIGMSIGGAVASALAANAEAEAAQAVARYNAQLAKIQADERAKQIRTQGRRDISSQFVRMAAKSGIVAEEGGWLEVLSANEAAYENAAVAAYAAGHNSAALNYARADIAGQMGTQGIAAAVIGGANRIANIGISYGIPR